MSILFIFFLVSFFFRLFHMYQKVYGVWNIKTYQTVALLLDIIPTSVQLRVSYICSLSKVPCTDAIAKANYYLSEVLLEGRYSVWLLVFNQWSSLLMLWSLAFIVCCVVIVFVVIKAIGQYVDKENCWLINQQSYRVTTSSNLAWRHVNKNCVEHTYRRDPHSSSSIMILRMIPMCFCKR